MFYFFLSVYRSRQPMPMVWYVWSLLLQTKKSTGYCSRLLLLAMQTWCIMLSLMLQFPRNVFFFFRLFVCATFIFVGVLSAIFCVGSCYVLASPIYNMYQQKGAKTRFIQSLCALSRIGVSVVGDCQEDEIQPKRNENRTKQRKKLKKKLNKVHRIHLCYLHKHISYG